MIILGETGKVRRIKIKLADPLIGRSDLSVKELADKLNPVVRGWIEYYGAFFPSELIFLMYHLDKLIYRWVIRKYKKHGSNFKRAENWLKRTKRHSPNYFVHWGLLRA